MGLSCAAQEFDFYDLCGSLPTQSILWFSDKFGFFPLRLYKFSTFFLHLVLFLQFLLSYLLSSGLLLRVYFNMELGLSQTMMCIYLCLSILQMKNVQTENSGFKFINRWSCDMIQNHCVFLVLCFRHSFLKMEFTAI